MRPDRIIIGECRGAETLDMIQAMNTGHEGSMTTVHANTPRDAMSRLETMISMAGLELPIRALRAQFASAVDLIIQASRLAGGPRKVTSISEVVGMEGDTIIMQEIFAFRPQGIDANGRAYGDFVATGVRPTFMERLEQAGCSVPPDLFKQRVMLAIDPGGAGEGFSMSGAILMPVLIGVGVLVVVVAVALMTTKSSGEAAEQRLDQMTTRAPIGESGADSLLKAMPIDPDRPTVWTNLLPKFEDIRKLYEQADVNLPFDKFMMIVVALSILGAAVAVATKLPYMLIPLGSAAVGMAPFFWLVRRKRKRVQAFVSAMPEAVELMSRALRAGHGMASGMNLVAEEMTGPIAQEFARVFYEQNLGVPIEISLRGLADRVPSMDVRVFVTAIVIQRGTGGDLAEVLEKIGKLIRQRYELFGHVRALTAEGRLSGIVLLALPPALLAFLTMSNYTYVSPMYTTPAGTKILAITAFLQVVGALCIKKIVAIKV